MRETIEPLPTVIEEEDIARRAFQLYEARGREDGHDLESWVQARQELEDQRRKALPEQLQLVHDTLSGGCASGWS